MWRAVPISRIMSSLLSIACVEDVREDNILLSGHPTVTVVLFWWYLIIPSSFTSRQPAPVFQSSLLGRTAYWRFPLCRQLFLEAFPEHQVWFCLCSTSELPSFWFRMVRPWWWAFVQAFSNFFPPSWGPQGGSRRRLSSTLYYWVASLQAFPSMAFNPNSLRVKISLKAGDVFIIIIFHSPPVKSLCLQHSTSLPSQQFYLLHLFSGHVLHGCLTVL